MLSNFGAQPDPSFNQPSGPQNSGPSIDTSSFTPPTGGGQSGASGSNFGAQPDSVNDVVNAITHPSNQQPPTSGHGALYNFAGDVVHGLAGTTKDAMQNWWNEVQNSSKGFSDSWNKMNEGAAEAGDASGNNPFSFKNPGQQLGGIGKMSEGILGLTGNTVRAVFAPLTGILETAAKGAGTAGADILGAKGGDAVNNAIATPGGQKVKGAVNTVQAKIAAFAKSNPDAAQAMNNGLQTLMGLVGDDPVNDTGDTVVDHVASGLDAAKTETPKAIGAASDAVSNAADTVHSAVSDAASALKEKMNPTPTPDAVTGKIIQGKTGDVAAGQDSLSRVDPANVNNYSDLSNELQNNINRGRSAQDAYLASRTDIAPTKLADLSTEAGGKTFNPTQDALDQLRNHAESTSDPALTSKVQAWDAKANGDGLTPQDINNIAREHGQQFKSFNANGEVSKGLSAQNAENTRAGVKQTARDLVNDPTFKASDAEMSNDIHTKKIVDSMVEKVNTAKQQIVDQGFVKKWGTKLGTTAGKIFDTITGGSVKGFLKDMIGKPEADTAKPLDLNSAVGKNIAKLQNILDYSPDAQSAAARLENLATQVREAAPEPIPKGETTTSTAKASDLTYGTPKSDIIKVNSYQSQFPKYFTQDQIDAATEMLKAQDNAGKTIDMKAIDTVVKRVKDMQDIKPISDTMAKTNEAARLNRISKIPVKVETPNLKAPEIKIGKMYGGLPDSEDIKAMYNDVKNIKK